MRYLWRGQLTAWLIMCVVWMTTIIGSMPKATEPYTAETVWTAIVIFILIPAFYGWMAAIEHREDRE